MLGRIHGQNARFGHILREGGLGPPPKGALESASVVVVGAGVAGLACAWRLRRAGVEGVLVLEAGETPGGNARWGENEITRYPWGAHYLRAPTREHPALERFLTEVRLVRGRDAQGRIDWDTRAVCADPLERLLEKGIWRQGLLPRDADPEEVRRFEEFVESFARRRGRDGRRAFALPLAASSRDEDLLALDRRSFADWLDEKGFRSPGLLWYLEYACRDDYGCTLATTSAWAGLHYFAARADEGPDREVILAWPEGNGRLVQYLLEAGQPRLRTGRLCYRLLPERGEAWVVSADGGARSRCRGEQLVFAGPSFLLGRLLPEPPPGLEDFTYAPWLVANVTLARPPGGVGAPLAWDNVFRASRSLGYVVANRGARGPTVVTWYLPLTGDPREERRRLLALDHATAARLVVDDLLAAHPSLADAVRAVDVWRWGHAMIRPVPGFIWGEARRLAASHEGPLVRAHSDLSGLSLFEEAFYRGVRAGEEVLRRRGVDFDSYL